MRKFVKDKYSAGSVVTKDIPGNVVAAGNPCRVLRPITDDDRRRLYPSRTLDDEAWEHVQNG